MVALNCALAFSIALNLCSVMMFDDVEQCTQQLEELRGRRIGQPRQEQRDEDGDALHVSSSMAVAMCSALIWRDLVDAAAESA